MEAYELAQEYLDVQRRIEELEGRARLIKDNLAAMLPLPDGALTDPSGWPKDAVTWKYENAVVQWVRGRRSEKLDPKSLRKALVLAGVDVDVVEKAFARATSVTVGSPYMRVSREAEPE